MNRERFEELLDELDGQSLQTLKEKNARYASDDDCLHNFDSGAEIMNCTPVQCAWGYMTKHIVALRDMVEKDDFSNREDFLEKCQDIINYIRFIWLIGNDDVDTYKFSPVEMNKNLFKLDVVTEPVIKKMTLKEIEDELGYKVEIIDKGNMNDGISK